MKLFFVPSSRVVACFFFFQAEDGIRDATVTGVQTCALPIYPVLRVLHSLLEACLALRIAIEEAQRELEGLIRVAGQVHELEKGDPLRVVEEDGLPILIHLEPARGGPAGDSREGSRKSVV